MVGRPYRVALLVALMGCQTSTPALVETDWERDRQTLDQLVEARTDYAQADLRSWTRSGSLAATYAERARHTGNLDDFEAAEQALAQAFDHAVEGSGPLMEQARLDLSLHRFESAIGHAEQTLSAIVVSNSDRAAALSVIGRAAIELGQVERGGAALEQAHALAPTAASWADLAVYSTKIGDLDAADVAWSEARAVCLCSGSRFDGWIALQRGLVPLDGQDYTQALAWFEEAEARYSGDWVFQEHRAEALAALGRFEQADAVYAQSVATVRDPEVLGAWADVRLELGDEMGADALIREARVRFLQAESRYPEAMSAHAEAFFARHGR